MSVSYYQIMYTESEGNFEKANDSKSAGLYKLNYLSQGENFRKFLMEKYSHEVYDFASDKNLVGEMAISKEYLKPDLILDDLEIYKKLLDDIKMEIKNPTNELLDKEIKNWSINDNTIEWITNEIKELEKVCTFAKNKGYVMKFVCDY